MGVKYPGKKDVNVMCHFSNKHSTVTTVLKVFSYVFLLPEANVSNWRLRKRHIRHAKSFSTQKLQRETLWFYVKSVYVSHVFNNCYFTAGRKQIHHQFLNKATCFSSPPFQKHAWVGGLRSSVMLFDVALS